MIKNIKLIYKLKEILDEWKIMLENYELRSLMEKRDRIFLGELFLGASLIFEVIEENTGLPRTEQLPIHSNSFQQ